MKFNIFGKGGTEKKTQPAGNMQKKENSKEKSQLKTETRNETVKDKKDIKKEEKKPDKQKKSPEKPPKPKDPKKIIAFGAIILVLIAILIALNTNILGQLSNIEMDTGIIVTLILVIVLILLLAMRKIMEHKAKKAGIIKVEAKKAELKKSEPKIETNEIMAVDKLKTMHKGLFSFFRKKLKVDAGESKTEPKLQSGIKSQPDTKFQAKGDGKKEQSKAFEEEIIIQKKKRLNQIMVLLIGIGIICVIISFFLQGILLKILAIIILLVPIVILAKNNKRTKKTEEIALNLDEYNDVSQILNKVADLNKKKDVLMKEFEDIGDSLTKLEIKKQSLSNLGKTDSDTTSGITVIQKIETIEEEKKLPQVIITTKNVQSKEFETDIDLLLEIINKRKRVKILDIAKFFEQDIQSIMSLAKILEEHGLIQIHYPTFGDLELVAVQSKIEGM